MTYQRLSKVFNRLVGLGRMINFSSNRSSVYLIGTVKYKLPSVMILTRKCIPTYLFFLIWILITCSRLLNGKIQDQIDGEQHRSSKEAYNASEFGCWNRDHFMKTSLSQYDISAWISTNLQKMLRLVFSNVTPKC